MRFRWKHLEPVFGSTLAQNVTGEMINGYVDRRRAEGAEDSTINRELSLLKRALRLNHLSDKPGRLARMPKFPTIKERNVRKGFIDDAEYARLTAQVTDAWLRLFVEIAYTYGMRRSEIANLRVSQVDLVRRTIRLEVGATKNDEGREVIMTPAVYELARQAMVGKKAEDLLITRETVGRSGISASAGAS
ncbi:MAG TPA: tyrosine-type recombinase/integrase [Terriglobales bacterium]|nr:tyrosine-type recombinase/integrase [Terriglobales bacterium]